MYVKCPYCMVDNINGILALHQHKYMNHRIEFVKEQIAGLEGEIASKQRSLALAKKKLAELEAAPAATEGLA